MAIGGRLANLPRSTTGRPRAIGGRARSALPVQPRRPEGVSKDLLHEYSRRMRRSKAGFEGLARAQRRGRGLPERLAPVATTKENECRHKRAHRCEDHWRDSK